MVWEGKNIEVGGIGDLKGKKKEKKMFSHILRLSYTSSERNNNTCDMSHFEFWPIGSLEFISR